jgi:hypothetical protein
MPDKVGAVTVTAEEVNAPRAPSVKELEAT